MKSIPLTKGFSAIVDNSDFGLVSKFKWYADVNKTTIYASCHTSQKGIRISMRMHQLIMGSKKGEKVDHFDGNGLNNRRSNLRICSNQQNHGNRKLSPKNTSGFKGVSFDKKSNKWMVAVGGRGNRIYVGRFDSPIKAANAYDVAAIKFFGSFAKTNQMLKLNPAKQ